MRHTMNRNLQVTRENYAACVDAQVAFLHQQDGTDRPEHMVSVDDTRDFYDHGVSVDAAADDLFYQGF